MSLLTISSFQEIQSWTITYRLDGDNNIHHFADCELPVCAKNIFEALRVSAHFLPNGALILGAKVKEERDK